MLSKLFLPFLALLLLLPCISSFGQSLAEAKAIIKEQAEMLERFEALTMKLQAELNAKDKALIEASNELTVSLTEQQALRTDLTQQQEQNKIDQQEIEKLKILWSAHETYDRDQESSLKARQTERDMVIGIAAVIALGWIVDRAFIR